VIPALIIGAMAVGALHTMAPDHWLPFAALARSRGWSSRRAARTTVLCGFGHVTVSAALAVAALFLGLTAVHAIGSRLENQAIYLLMGFGVVYMLWGLRRSFRRDPLAVTHPHHHPHGQHDHDHGLTEWSLFVLFSADPCVAVIPMVMAAAGSGWHAVALVIVAYEIATIGTMVLLVVTAHAGIGALRAPWLNRYGDAAAGALIVTMGAVLAVLGV
jgi:nickel/cobalt transporter (NicO) family protein